MKNNEKIKSKKNIPLVLTYYRTLPDIPKAVRKNWHILQINPELHNVFVNKPTIAFKRNKNIQDFIDGNLIKDEKVAKKELENPQGKSKTYDIRRSALCCMQKY